ncbi:MAG: DUF5011 domain-containing protein, partial [Gammaproteobacteria bacterium]|nr:DUF5011 domain-containing protein [Gammaproteobacteria bacterium]
MDTTAPAITLLGNDPETVEYGTPYTDAGTTALDGYDGDVTGSISTGGSVDINTIGQYTITYDVTDSSGNAATTVSRVINVTAATSGSFVLSPQDTYLNINTTIYANSQTLNTYTWPDNTSANAILMKYDLSSIPNGANIQEATLYLSLVESDSTSDSTYTITAHKIINNNPDISLATGYTYDGTNNWTGNLAQGDFSAAYDTMDIDKTLEYKSW